MIINNLYLLILFLVVATTSSVDSQRETALSSSDNNKFQEIFISTHNLNGQSDSDIDDVFSTNNNNSSSTQSSDSQSRDKHQTSPSNESQQSATPKANLGGHLKFEFQRYDGWYNNLANSDWGSSNSRLRRKVAPAYSDGVYQMPEEGRPSARQLSQQMMRGQDGLGSRRNLTTLFAFFGQLISSEILMASELGCPIEMHRIKIDQCDPMYDRDCKGSRTMPFYRTAYDPATGQSPNSPREQLNKVTSWIDGSFIYSTSETWLNTMRSFNGHGTLKMDIVGGGDSPDQMLAPLAGLPLRNKERAPLQNHIPAHHLKVKTAERMFLLGDPRTNQNPVILALGILFYRWHNVLAERIYAQHNDWSDEEIFQRARRLVIASMQNIILYEYLPLLLNTSTNSTSTSNTGSQDNEEIVQPYSGYKPDLHPGISHVFQSAAFRFGHTLIPPGLYLRDAKCNFLETEQGFKGIRLCSTWWNAEEIISQIGGIEQLLMGASSQIAEREDSVLCNDVRDKLFGTLDFNRRDLAALNIMRGRDNGIPDYNSVRQAFKLPRITKWSDINPSLFAKDPKIFHELVRMYDGQLDRVDLYVGGMLESDVEQGRPGPLFRRIIREQFERLRDSDRFWFENRESGIFSESEIAQIKSISLYDIIVNSTLIPENSIQKRVFQFSQNDPCPQPGQLSSEKLQPCYAIRGHSYFKGNELPYTLICITLVLIPILCHIVASCIVRRQERLRQHHKTRLEYRRNMAAHQQQNLNKPSSVDPNSTSAVKPTTSNKKSDSSEKFYTKEWLHSNLKRKIKIRFGPAPDEALYVVDRRGQVQRRLDLGQTKTIVIELSSDLSISPEPLQSASRTSLESLYSASAVDSSRRGSQMQLVAGNSGVKLDLKSLQHQRQSHQLDLVELDKPIRHKPMVLIRVERNYDLVLQFCDVQQRRRFLFRLQAYLESINKNLAFFRVSREMMLANAETKERRQQRLEQFFREAYALTFGLSTHSDSNSNSGSSIKPVSSSNSSPASSDVGFVMRTSLSRQEFAEALGMRCDSLFVRQMFNCIDKDGNGRISFQEFLDTVVMFSRGKPDDKLRIVFDMCVTDSRGLIEKSDLVRVLRSLVDMAKTRTLSELDIMRMIDEMFTSVGLQDKQLLSYEDFKLIINRHNNESASTPTTTIVSSTTSATQDLNENKNMLIMSDAKRSPYNRILAIGLDMKGAHRNFLLDTSAACVAQGEALEQEQQLVFEATENNDHAEQENERPKSPAHSEGSSIESHASSSRQLGRQVKSKQKIKDTQQGPEKAKKSNTEPFFWVRWARAFDDRWRAYITELEQHGKDIIYMLSFFVIVFVLFMERFIQYSFLSEHMDLRHVMGFGIAITRGSAASLSFCYAMLLLTMCRNLMTRLRTTSLGQYLPLDSHVKFHKTIAWTALVMTVAHSVGHCVNFFHVTQQPVEHLRCLTKEMQFSVEARPTFAYWVFQTVTGSTGVLLWVLCSIMYIFAQAKVRQKAYKYFWSTHQLYYLIYALTLLHGSSKLTGSPKFWIFFMIPAILFAIDKVISLQTKLLELEIFETECLPSDVISLKFARPPSFKFKSGQWVRIACTAFRPHEFHAFTLTSSPQDDFLSVHVRAQGPWTWKLRSLFDPANLQYNQLLPATSNTAANDGQQASKATSLPPRIRIDGPFGGGNQDWYRYEVAVMICGGIGVTPYASILNDLVFNTSTNRYSGVSYKKIYFIWICPSHRNYEWFIDVLRDVEAKDVTNLLEMHIYITQFFHKFDLRTTMLYICENHFQRISNRSLFTGLRAVNHFERPDIAEILEQVQKRHAYVNKVGVLSCGPRALTKSVESACAKVNNKRKSPLFLHQYENFS